MAAYMTVMEVAEELRFTETAANPREAVYKWIRAYAVPTYRRGIRTVLIKRSDVESVMRFGRRA